MSDENYLVVVFSGSSAQAGLIKGALEAKNITAFLKDEFLGAIAPVYTGAGLYQAVKVMVRQQDVEKAKEILKQLEP
ncbi:MAG TPA: DUF2007 domain-containing protein [Elusimicrobiales bacterium]|nr:DUF2007 domain-containing protein [Elusimicrobiales bacterium]